MMTEQFVPEFLKDALKFGIVPGLDRINELLSHLDNPETKFKTVHIAGTNGKGSTAAFISSCLSEAGYKTGMFTSPYLERFSERMKIIDGALGLKRYIEDEESAQISSGDLKRLSEKVEDATRIMVKAGYEHPTEFELVTALSFLWFAENDIDIAVLETGLGGRLDSTNVIKEPLATVITSIGYDHQDRLGDTIDLITAEKAGIFKRNVPVFAASPEQMLLPEADRLIVRKTLVKEASSKGASGITFVKARPESALFTDEGQMRFLYDGDKYETRLLGRHQVCNASLAVKVMKDVFKLPRDLISEGIRDTVWKGRAELISKDPYVILDGGHNVQCAQSLIDTLKLMCGGRFRDLRFRVVMGVMKDKNVEGMLQAFKDGGLNPLEVYAVRVNNPRSEDPRTLSKLTGLMYNKSIMPLSFDDAWEAVSLAYRKTCEDGIPLLVTGSLYLLGEVRGKLCTIT